MNPLVTGHLLSIDSPRSWLEQITKIGQDLLQKTWSLEMLQADLRQTTTLGWVLHDSQSNCIVGYTLLQHVGDELEIIHLVVDVPFQKKGLGHTLIEHVLKIAVQQHCQRIFLDVRQSNAPALHLYQSHGFKKIGVRKRYYADTLEDAWVMQWTQPVHSSVSGTTASP